MALALSLIAGFVLGFRASIYALGPVGIVMSVLLGGAAFWLDGWAHAAATVAMVWLLLQIGFGVGLVVCAVQLKYDEQSEAAH